MFLSPGYAAAIPISAGAVVGVALEVRNVITAENDTNLVRRITANLTNEFVELKARHRVWKVWKLCAHGMIAARISFRAEGRIHWRVACPAHGPHEVRQKAEPISCKIRVQLSPRMVRECRKRLTTAVLLRQNGPTKPRDKRPGVSRKRAKKSVTPNDNSNGALRALSL